MRSETAAQNATATAVRSGASLVRSVKVEQRATAAGALSLQIFNTNSPTVGTTAPIMVVPVPAGNSTLEASVLDISLHGPLGGLYCSTGLSYACTTTPSGSTNPTAGQEPTVRVDYNQVGA